NTCVEMTMDFYQRSNDVITNIPAEESGSALGELEEEVTPDSINRYSRTGTQQGSGSTLGNRSGTSNVGQSIIHDLTSRIVKSLSWVRTSRTMELLLRSISIPLLADSSRLSQ